MCSTLCPFSLPPFHPCCYTVQVRSIHRPMAQDHTLMSSRFELKYLIPEKTALQVRTFVQQYLEVDEFGVGQPNLSYPVHSLYLDSDDLEIQRRTVNGDKNRWKLRVRYYNESEKTPVFFEIKRRMKD